MYRIHILYFLYGLTIPISIALANTKNQFVGYYFRRNKPLNLMKTSGADLTYSTLIPMPRRKEMVLFFQQWPQSYAGMDCDKQKMEV